MKGIRRLFIIDIAVTENNVQMLKKMFIIYSLQMALHYIYYICYSVLRCYRMLYKRKRVLKCQEVFPSIGIVKKEWIFSFSEVVTVSVLRF